MKIRHYMLLTIMILFLIPSLSPAGFPTNNYPKRLTGAWQITLKITPSPGVPSFLPEKITLLSNFTRSGEFISSTDLPTLQVPLPTGEDLLLKVGNGHGIWAQNGFNDFTLETKRLVQLAVPPESLFGFANGTAQVSFDGDKNTISGVVELQLQGADGTLFPPAFGSVDGVRLFTD